MIKIDTLGNFASGHREKHGTPSVVTGLQRCVSSDQLKKVQRSHASIVFQSYTSLVRIRSFHKDELVLPDFVENALEVDKEIVDSEPIMIMAYHVVPSSNDGLHIQITRKEGDNSIWDDLAVFDKDAPEVANHCGVIADLEARAHSDLITSSCYDLDRTTLRAGRIRRRVNLPVARRHYA